MLITVIVGLSFLLYLITKDNLKLKRTLPGTPTNLEEAAKRLLYPGDTRKVFLLHSFVAMRVPVHVRLYKEVILGCGLISHPEHPNKIVFTDIIFRHNGKIILGKRYELVVEDGGAKVLVLIED